MSKYKFLTVGLFLFNFGFAQQSMIGYYKNSNFAKELYVQNKIKESAFVLEKAMKEFNFCALSDLILLAKVNFILKRNGDAYKATVKAIKLGIGKVGLLESFSDSLGLVFQESSEYKKAIANFEKYNLEFKEKLNTERLLEIQQMLSIDIYARGLKTSDFCIQSFAYTVVRNADSLNEIKLRKNIETYGFPSFEEIGLIEMSKIMVIIMHITAYRDKEDLYKFYDSTLKEQVLLGNFLPSQYATFVDRHRAVSLAMPQKYGAFTTRVAYTDNIEDIKNVDFERSKIGLMPIYIESKLYTNKKLPKEYIYDFNPILK